MPGPDGRPVAAGWLLLPDGTAVLELAQSSGLPLLRTPDPLGAPHVRARRGRGRAAVSPPV
ncbi:hypothetical protein JNW87_20180, partial [Micromonospora sp. ATA51]|nr:hypothetical protein [Micromonospora sp. ATA51]